MNTTAASYSSLSTEHALLKGGARRESREALYAAGRHYVLATESPLNSDQDSDSVLSIQAKETDYVQDTSDTASYCSDDFPEYEPDSECDERPPSVDTDSSSVICTRVVSVRAPDERSLEADGEQSESSDAELGPPDYWRCLRCRARNNNPLYRYCETCFQVRKSWFPPRPKRKSRPDTRREPAVDSSRDPAVLSSLPSLPSLSSLSQTDSGIDSTSNSQELCPAPTSAVPSLVSLARRASGRASSAPERRVAAAYRETEPAVGSKRRPEGESGPAKRRKRSSSSDGDVYGAGAGAGGAAGGVAPRALASSLAEAEGALCITCCARPKSGVFVHGRIAHICCCYGCAERVWNSHRRCPVCNSRVSNILKAVVM